MECLNPQTSFLPKIMTVFGPVPLSVFINDFHEGKDATMSEIGQAKINTAWYLLYVESKKKSQAPRRSRELVAGDWGK